QASGLVRRTCAMGQRDHAAFGKIGTLPSGIRAGDRVPSHGPVEFANREAGGMIEKQVDIQTKDGRMGTFVCHPERGGPHPIILFFMDAPGIREELRNMARRLASAGYYVMLPNLFYRSGVEELGNFIGEEGAATRKKMFALIETINIPLVMADTD